MAQAAKSGSGNEVQGRSGSSNVADAMNKGKDALDSASQKAKELAAKGSEMASRVGEKAEEMMARGSQMISSASEQAVSAVGHGVRHIQEQGLGGLGNDAANLIRRYPVQSILIGIGIGFLIARATSSRGD